MRNLKKILALALALVMSMSLMATANAFTDDEKITDTYETAVNVLSGLKVFQGYDEGDFRPQGAITRAEVAAIIYRIVTGDVNDTQVGIYADYGLFDDVASTSWYAGYVNFCANAEYIKGYDADTFGPNDPITGYQALAMILRALGYDKNGEFTGTSWHIQTAAVGEQRKITKNITAGTLQSPATREVVAEILFRAILVETVNYTPAFGYQIGDTSLGEKTFGLEEITGVVVANEYADLYADHTMRAGRTELEGANGKSYTIDYTTYLEDIGEARTAYITGSTVLAIGDAGNTVFDTGDEVSISGDSKFESNTGLQRDDDTEYFVNFDGGDTYKSSNWKIKYVLKLKDNAAADAWEDDYKDNGGSASASNVKVDGNEVSVTFPKNTKISKYDMTQMEKIFDGADRDEDDFIDGEVYVGTQSVTDISDDPDVSWESFVDKYIDTDKNSITVSGNENGNWLKVIDNDGDGIADYVLKTVYTAAAVEDINRDDTVELDVLDRLFKDPSTTNDDSFNELDDDIGIVTDDELSVGDIVYYAVIDGKAQTYLAEVVTAKIDKVNRNTLTATTTDGEEYIQSGVHNHIQDTDVYMDGVKNLEGGVSYDLYLDKYGYLVAYAYTAANGNFALLTDGWFMSQRAGDEYAAMVWDGEELVDTDITSGGSMFIDSDHNNNWGQLREIGKINNDGHVMTTLVGSLNEDGELVPVDEAFTRKNVRVISTDLNTIPKNAYTSGTAYETKGSRNAYDTALTGSVEVRALSTTVYYYVYPDSSGTIVKEYVGYANLPTLAAGDADYIEDVYVVGTETDRGSGLAGTTYYTANIVVVEFSRPYRANAEKVFIVDLPVVSSNVKLEEALVIRANGAEETVTIDLSKSKLRDYDPAGNKWTWKDAVPGLYYMWETTEDGIYTVQAMSPEEIAASNYTVGQVITTWGTGSYDYTEIQAFSYAGADLADYDDTVTGETPEYRITEGSVLYNLSYSFDNDGDPIATLDQDDMREVLDERVNETTKVEREAFEDEDGNGVWDRGEYSWNYNDVLVAYNGDGDIVYAISFANLDGDNMNFAQLVWNEAKPLDVVIGAPVVTFYGEPVALTAGSYVTALDYADVDEAMDPNGIDVKNGEIVVGNKTTDVDVAGDTYEGTIQGEDGKFYTFTLTQNPANTEAKLYKVADDQEATPADLLLTTARTIPEYVERFYASEGATVVWSFSTITGTPFTVTVDADGVADYSKVPNNVTTTEVNSVKATVTPEDGGTAGIYRDKTGTDADSALATNKLAIKTNIDSSTVLTGVTTYATNAGVMAARAALEQAIDNCNSDTELDKIYHDTDFVETNVYVKALTDAIDAAEKAAEDEAKADNLADVQAALAALKLPDDKNVTVTAAGATATTTEIETAIETALNSLAGTKGENVTVTVDVTVNTPYSPLAVNAKDTVSCTVTLSGSKGAGATAATDKVVETVDFVVTVTQ